MVSTIFLMLMFLMIVTYAWKAPRREHQPDSHPPTHSIAEEVVSKVEDKGVTIRAAAEKFKPLVVTPDVVAFSDSSTAEHLEFGWVARKSSHAEQVLSTLWMKSSIREFTTALIEEIDAAVDFEIEIDMPQKKMHFPDGTSIYYNNRLHSWMLEKEDHVKK